MSIPYAFVKALRGKPSRLDKSSRVPKEQANYLLKKNHMQGHYLGDCLDSSRWGSMTTVMYEMSIKKLIFFIQSWTRQNQGNFQNLWHEKKINELYTKFELPYMHKESCLGENHEETILDLKGRLRCAYKNDIRFKPSFVIHYSLFDEELNMNRTYFFEDEPHSPLPDDAWDEVTGDILPEYEKEFLKYEEELERFKNEEKNFVVTDFCYSIISEKGTVLPLETIIRRLNLRPESNKIYCREGHFSGSCKKLNKLSKEERETYDITGFCPGHIEPYNYTEFPFDGWTLAFYVQKWYEQLPNGDSPWFDKEKN